MTTKQADDSKTITFVARAYGRSDVGDSPSYATFAVDHALLGQLATLVQVCKAHDLTEVRVSGSPAWGPGGIAAKLWLRGGEMVVLPGGSFWFTARPKYGDYCIESGAAEFTDVQAAFEAAANGGLVFQPSDPDLRELYLEDTSLAGLGGEPADGD